VKYIFPFLLNLFACQRTKTTFTFRLIIPLHCLRLYSSAKPGVWLSLPLDDFFFHPDMLSQCTHSVNCHQTCPVCLNPGRWESLGSSWHPAAFKAQVKGKSSCRYFLSQKITSENHDTLTQRKKCLRAKLLTANVKYLQRLSNRTIEAASSKHSASLTHTQERSHAHMDPSDRPQAWLPNLGSSFSCLRTGQSSISGAGQLPRTEKTLTLLYCGEFMIQNHPDI
jgi:hypothetical protein